MEKKELKTGVSRIPLKIRGRRLENDKYPKRKEATRRVIRRAQGAESVTLGGGVDGDRIRSCTSLGGDSREVNFWRPSPEKNFRVVN